jgi:hypothetical protein
VNQSCGIIGLKLAPQVQSLGKAFNFDGCRTACRVRIPVGDGGWLRA